MTQSPDHLYIFLHIPKCAGTTFSEHLKYNFKSRQRLSIGPSRHRGFQERSEVDDYIHSLPASVKDGIQVVFGHSVYYGIHEHFSRPARYITFLREPVSQVISHYEYFLQHYDSLIADQPSRGYPKDKSELTFDRWRQIFDVNMQIPTVLNYAVNGRIGVNGDADINEAHLECAKQILDKYYFVGLLESFEEDSLFLYDELGMRRFIRKPQNVARKKHLHVDEMLKQEIRSAVTLDLRLYDYAVSLNRSFKDKREDLPEIAERVRQQGRYVIPLKLIATDWILSTFGIGAIMALQKVKARVKDLVWR